MKATIAAFAVGILFLALSVAFAQTRGSDKPPAIAPPHYNPAIYEELQKAPEKARNRINPLQADPDAVAAGSILFAQHCAECHGEVGEGSPKGPSLLVREVQTASPGAIFWVLTNGVVRKKMPVWSKLPEPQRWQLVRYIKSLGAPARASESPASKP